MLPQKPHLKFISRESLPESHSRSIHWNVASETLAAFNKKYQMTEIKGQNNRMSVDGIPISGDTSSNTHLKVSGLDQQKSSPRAELVTDNILANSITKSNYPC